MSRRFLNMVSQKYGSRLYTLCRIELNKHIFYESAAAAVQQVAKAKKMRDGWPSTISNCKRLPRSEISFSAAPGLASNSNFHFFSLVPGQGEGCVMATDPHCNTAIYDSAMGSVLLLPPANFRKPCNSIALSIPKRRCANSSSLSHEDDHALYVMSRSDGSFELFNYCRTRVSDSPPVDNNWYWFSLPRLPPWLGDRGTTNVVSRPFAAAVVDNTNTIYVSTSDGTYAYDTSTGIWRQAGSWVLPFRGSAEYVPELGLWFGVKGPDSPQHRLCAFDLNSSAGPSSLYEWGYLDDLPDEWATLERHLVYVGSGKFCIVTHCIHISSSEEENVTNEELTLLTGVELVDRGDGIEMIEHRSQRYNIQDARIHCVL
uniref:Uncharacterized protein n=2 Tax=Avena sativa TaxID=4498 RepID=A0ACD5Y8U3_AVESA